MNNIITLKDLIDENFQDYKKASMFLAFPKCDFKCFRELNLLPSMCQNFESFKRKDMKIKIEDIFKRYENNPITSAIVLGGLEPFFSFEEILNLVSYFRKNNCYDNFVIYTGYYLSEIYDKVEQLKKFKNIIIKFGRYIPNSNKVFDNVLGVNLISDNQFAMKIS